ncbi:MAG: hypothetical protein GY716_20685 [bacterium]|nr:hypothetical protein [bacterium]
MDSAGTPGRTAPAFVRGFTLPLLAVRLLLGSRGVKRYALLPLLASVVVYTGVVGLCLRWIAGWAPQVDAWAFWGPVGGWLSTAVNYAAGPLKWVVLLPAVLVICYFTFTTIGMVIASPFNDLLSARVERLLCRPREEQSQPLHVTARLVVLSLLDALRIAALQILCTILVLPLLFVPLVGFVPLLAVNAYFTGLGFFDVALARNDLRHRHKKPAFREQRAALFGLGLCMELLFFVPFAGLLLLPLGVVAGTRLYCDTDWTRLLADSGLEHPESFRPPVPLRGR